MLELESLYSLLQTVLPDAKLIASKSSLFPILEKSPDENPMNLIFIILTGPAAEETATSLYISLFYKTNKGEFYNAVIRLTATPYRQILEKIQIAGLSPSAFAGEIQSKALY